VAAFQSGNKWQQEWARRQRSSDYEVALATTTDANPVSSSLRSERHTHLQEKF